AFALVLVPFLGFSSSAKLAPDLAQIGPQSKVDVIIQFATPPGNAQHARIMQRGGLLKTDLDLVKAAAYSLPAAALDALADDPEIVYISPDREVTPALDYANATVGAPIALQYGWDGTGVGIAVIDSGITDGRDFLDKKNNASNVSRIVYNQSFVSGASSAMDLYGHGTHVAGILAGNGTASTGSNYFKTFRGIAPSAKLINLRVLDGN